MLSRALALLLAAWMAVLPAHGSQPTLQMPTTGTVSGLQFSNRVTDALDALVTCNSGPSAPTNAAGGAPKAGQCWLDNTSATLLRKYRYSGSAWVLEAHIDVTNGIWAPPIGGGAATVASAATTSICGALSPQGYVIISGTTTITSFGTNCLVGQTKVLRFLSTLTLTHNATSLILPGGLNITTSVGDTAFVISEGAGNWRVAHYAPVTGQAVINPAVEVGSFMWGGQADTPAKYVLAYGQALARVDYPDYVSKMTRTQSATRSAGNATLTSVANTSKMGVGMPVEGAGLTGCTISSVTASTIVLASGACVSTSGTSNVTVFLPGYGAGGNSSTIGVPPCAGRSLVARADMSGTPDSVLTSTFYGASVTASFSPGGTQSKTIGQTNLPNVFFTVSGISLSDPGHTHNIPAYNLRGDFTVNQGSMVAGFQSVGGVMPTASNNTTPMSIATQGVASSGGSGTAMSAIPPGLIADCMIRVLP